MRNQCLKVPQSSHQLEPDGSGLGCDAYLLMLGGELLGRLRVVGSEAMLNACGVGVAMSQGHSWTPHLLNGSW